MLVGLLTHQQNNVSPRINSTVSYQRKWTETRVFDATRKSFSKPKGFYVEWEKEEKKGKREERERERERD